jgi:hypothetical protein
VNHQRRVIIKKHKVKLNNGNAIMVDKALNPKIAQLTINYNLPGTALLWVIMQASSGNFLLKFRDNLSIPSSRGQSTSRLEFDIKHLSIDDMPHTSFDLYVAIFRRCLTNGKMMADIVKHAYMYGSFWINTLNAELNPICHLLALLGAHHILHISRIRVKYRMKCLLY